MTEVVASGAPGVVDRVAALLDAGEVVVVPTDTVYGLAARPDLAGAAARLFALKGRGATVPVAVLCHDAAQALDLAEDPTGRGARLAAALWPGPLTLVLPRRPGPVLHLGEPAGTVGLRCPDHDLVRALAARVGPVAATSANRHGELPVAGAAEAVEVFGEAVALVVDGGPAPGTASTVVDLTVEPWVVRREGPITRADLEQHLTFDV
ncbi:MAG: L-threonylcarbamoyladenylate synthase [Acidimicrobiia bacterium]